MGTSQFYFEAVELHVRLTELLRKTAVEMVSYDQKSRALIDCLSLCLRDLEQAIAENCGIYPEFSESAYRALHDYETNRDWFHHAYDTKREAPPHSRRH